MSNGPPEICNMEEARALIDAGLAKAELEFVTSLTAPLYRVWPGTARRWIVGVTYK